MYLVVDLRGRVLPREKIDGSQEVVVTRDQSVSPVRMSSVSFDKGLELWLVHRQDGGANEDLLHAVESDLVGCVPSPEFAAAYKLVKGARRCRRTEP